MSAQYHAPMRSSLLVSLAIVAGVLTTPQRYQASQDVDAALRERARASLRKAVEFYRTKVATQGGYHFAYAEDLSYGRSEMSEGPTRVEIQREGTPLVGLAYLDAYAATADAYYLDAARDVARALVKGQYCSGGWDYYIEFDPSKRAQFPYRADGGCARRDADASRAADDARRQRHAGRGARADARRSRARLQGCGDSRGRALCARQSDQGAVPERRLAAAVFAVPGGIRISPSSEPAIPSRGSGQWPGASYYTHYTFNDNSIVDAIDAMLEAARIYNEPRYLAAAEKGGEFILLAQMPEPQPGWAQQYDRDMHPAWARQFEPPSITGGESQSVAAGAAAAAIAKPGTGSISSRSRARSPTTSGRCCRTSPIHRRSAGARVRRTRRAWRASTSCTPTGRSTSRRGRASPRSDKA